MPLEQVVWKKREEAKLKKKLLFDAKQLVFYPKGQNTKAQEKRLVPKKQRLLRVVY